MGRIFFSEIDRDYYFSSLKKISGLSWNTLSKSIGISGRQLRDWKKGVHSFPESYAKRFEGKFGLKLPNDIVIKETNWHIQAAAKLGGKKRFELYGSPATTEGRRKGGINSIKIHRLNKTGFKVSKPINIPNRNEELAEVMGAIMGDGGLSPMQLKISLNIKTDKDYANYLKNLLGKLFKIQVSIYERVQYSTITLAMNSNKLVFFLNKNGLPIGNKIIQNVDMPDWIHQRKTWQRACLRGLFDTDGCTYIDKHFYRMKSYKHICVAFTNYSIPLLKSIDKVLCALNYHPTLTTRRRVLLRREKEVYRFFKEIKPSNIRHSNKLKEFLEEYQSGCNGVVSKTAVA